MLCLYPGNVDESRIQGHPNVVRPVESEMRRERAEYLAIEALSFLANDMDKLGAFLTQTGLEPTRLRQAAADPGFLAGVLDFFAADEEYLLKFAEYLQVSPDVIARARTVLGGIIPDGTY